MKPTAFRAVGAKLASVAGYASFRLRHGSASNEESQFNRSLSGYPRNHNFTIRNGQLIPSFKLFERVRLISPLLSEEMDSFLDIGCSRGFFVFHAARQPGCRLAVGVDVHEPFVSLSQQVAQRLRIERCAFHLATLEDLAKDPAAFGGPFHTILNIGTYHYLYWGSSLCSTSYLDHREILRRFADICTNRVIISARFEVDRLPDLPKTTALNHEKRRQYTSAAFLEAAAEFFQVQHCGFLGTYPLLLLRKASKKSAASTGASG